MWRQVHPVLRSASSARRVSPVARHGHAMLPRNIHGYRIAALLLIGSREQSLCEGCGKLFASSGRLRRHLLHSVSCRTNWGAFKPESSQGLGPSNGAAPPVRVRRTWTSCEAVLDPACYSKGLLDCLDSLDSPCAESVWATVVEFVEPLAVPRETLSIWARSHGHEEPFASAAEDAQLLLDPAICCDTFCPTRPSAPVAECCADLPGPLDSTLPFILTGPQATFHLDCPPCPGFCYPFIGGAPLSAAQKEAAYVEAMCHVIGSAIQQTSVSRVRLFADGKTLSALEPIPTWLMSVGFELRDDGLLSPED